MNLPHKLNTYRKTKMETKSKSEKRNKGPPQNNGEVIKSPLFFDDIEEKIIDLTGPIERKAQIIRHLLPVNWQPYLKSKLIDEKDFLFITRFERTQTLKEREDLLNEYNIDAYKTFIKVVQHVYVTKEIQQILVLIDDMLWEDISRVHNFKQAVSEPWKAFMDFLSCTDEFVRNLASRIISKLIAVHEYKPASSDIEFFLHWLKNELRNDNEYLLCVARCLQKLLRIDVYRLSFLNMNGIFKIIRILHSEIKPQALYQLTFCIWVASYNVEIAEKLNKYSVIQVLIEILESCPSEVIKLPRVIFATLRNLLEKPREPAVKKQHALVMIQCKMLKFLSILKTRKSTLEDPEFLEDFNAIEETLNKYVSELSTFDEYILEVRSGVLEWSVVHTSKRFWDENAHRLNENDYELLKKLIDLLEMSKESTILCVASNDLGEYMSHYPRGKTLVEHFGGKDVLLKLLNNENSTVKYHALKCLQIMMLNNYNLLDHFLDESNLVNSNKCSRL